jgi:uncharacterized protein YjiS (DUF1127 family)
MNRILSTPLQALAAVPRQESDTLYPAPARRSASAAFPWPGDYVRPRAANTNWFRNPAVIMRGWQPREVTRTTTYWSRLSTLVVDMVGRIAKWREEARSRQALLRLDDYALRDIGLDRASAQYVANLPVWHNDE